MSLRSGAEEEPAPVPVSSLARTEARVEFRHGGSRAGMYPSPRAEHCPPGPGVVVRDIDHEASGAAARIVAVRRC